MVKNLLDTEVSYVQNLQFLVSVCMFFSPPAIYANLHVIGFLERHGNWKTR